MLWVTWEMTWCIICETLIGITDLLYPEGSRGCYELTKVQEIINIF